MVRAGFEFEKLIADDNIELAKQYGVKGSPTLVITDGEKTEKFYGVPDIKKYLESARGARWLSPPFNFKFSPSIYRMINGVGLNRPAPSLSKCKGMVHHMHDIIIIGGGPAGMTAALYAQRNGKSALVLEKGGFGGQITYSPRVENYPGTLSMSGNEFADKMLEQILAQGAEVEVETVIDLVDDGAVKRVLTESGTEYAAKAVVIATGVRHRMLGLEGEYALVGTGISFCAVCDGEYYRGPDRRSRRRRKLRASGGNSFWPMSVKRSS